MASESLNDAANANARDAGRPVYRNTKTGIESAGTTWNIGGDANQALSGTLGAIGGAAARSLIEGSDFGDNLVAALPDIIGSTIGNMVAARLPIPSAEDQGTWVREGDGGDSQAYEGFKGSAYGAPSDLAAEYTEVSPLVGSTAVGNAAIDLELLNQGLANVKFGAVDEKTLRDQGILTGSYSATVRDDGSAYVDTAPKVKAGDRMIGSGAEDPGGTLFKLDAGAAAAGQQVTVEWAARENGSAGVYVVSVNGGQRHLLNSAGRIDGLGLSISNGADPYDYAAASARYEARVAAIEEVNATLNVALSYEATGNKDAAANMRLRAIDPAAADAARRSGLGKQAYNDGADFFETSYQMATAQVLGPAAARFAPQLHIRHATILPEERTGATTFTAASTAASIVAPAAGAEWAAARVGTASNYSRTPLVLERIGGAESTGPRVTANRLDGNAFRDEIAAALRAEGRGVQTEVYKKTPFGARYIDIEVSDVPGGKILGGIETKLGSSRYKPSQRAKDMFLRFAEKYPVNIVRKPR